jgi:hypothetical protein
MCYYSVDYIVSGLAMCRAHMSSLFRFLSTQHALTLFTPVTATVMDLFFFYCTLPLYLAINIPKSSQNHGLTFRWFWRQTLVDVV